MEDFAAELEVVAATETVLEVAERSEDLVAAAILLAIQIRPGDLAGGQILDARAGGILVGHERPVVAELSATHFREHRVAEHLVPLALVDPGPVPLVLRRAFGRIDRAGDARLKPNIQWLCAPL